MWIKICANTNLEDARLAAELGADAVGFVFAPSPRRVTPEQVTAIVAQLPVDIEKVGVFPQWSAEQIVDVVEQTGLTAIQLHAAFDPVLIRTLRVHFARKVAIIQVTHWAVDMDTHSATKLSAQVAQLAIMPEIDRILIDSKVGQTTGGTGISFPWQEAKPVFTAHGRLILAGGLNPDNISEAVHQLMPWGADVASGVEKSPGKKDPAKLTSFIQTARRASEPLGGASYR